MDWFRLRGIARDAVARAAEVGALNANARCSASSALIRREMVEDAVKARRHLVESAVGKHVRLRNSHVPAVVLDVLDAAESVQLGVSRRAAARHERRRLIVAEARVRRILARKIVVQADVELALVNASYWGIRKVEAQRRVAGIGSRIQLQDGQSSRIDHAPGPGSACRDLVAGCPRRLRPSRPGCQWTARHRVTLERSRNCGVRVGQIGEPVSILRAVEKPRTRRPERIVGKVTAQHRGCRNLAGERTPCRCLLP